MKRRRFLEWITCLFTSSAAVSTLPESKQATTVPECNHPKEDDENIIDLQVLLRLKPDDIIILKLKREITIEEAKKIHAEFNKCLRNHGIKNATAVVEKDIDICVLRN